MHNVIDNSSQFQSTLVAMNAKQIYTYDSLGAALLLKDKRSVLKVVREYPQYFKLLRIGYNTVRIEGDLEAYKEAMAGITAPRPTPESEKPQGKRNWRNAA